ncbi:UNVERIFIED_CONTAM: Dynamin-like protein ARC5 [Sesamum latifolium]|uniref:Dynamin-like protein ARC5 n=1 Tax=Sesamum latifolium TaxID=2727402 RepID=A0AAW2UZM0_9LAMI
MAEADSHQQFNAPPPLEEGQWKLYDAYNELHGLAQEFSTPFDAPAVLVVGHQTEGKSALVEALMGFQFNHVGGGTKTRRPITLHMKFNPDCHTPLCHLLSDSDPSVPQEKTLQEIQAYIEAENMRLERESYQFSSKEIIIRIEYKYCPNLTIIDTPGLIAPAPARKNRALQTQARAVESLVRAKMQHKEFIILCLEDCCDWSNATTRRVVMQIDPELSRTVVVSTKLDTKIPQFARASDVEVFLSPPPSTLDGFMLGDSPFFTSVPSGRVGSGHESVYKSNDEFKQAISLREMEDILALEEKLGRSLSKQERSRIGVSSLKLFLEELLQKRYMDSVPLIIPLLEKEHRSATRKLNEINQELSTLDEVKLKEKGRAFHDLFLTKLSLLLKGTVVAPPDKFGETLQDERVNGGAFIGTDGLQFPQKLIPNAGMRLYGGAQYHRAMAEFRFVVGGIKCPPITREEIVNACGVEDIHDGTNYSRTACVIAVAKARDTFEPFLHQLGGRLLHILKRLLPISVFLLQKDGEFLSGHEVFLKRVASAFNNFAESTERSCREKCMEDLVSTTRYVSWSLHNKWWLRNGVDPACSSQFVLQFLIEGRTLIELGYANSWTHLVDQNSLQLVLISVSVSPDLASGFVGNDKQEVKSRADVKLSNLASGNDSTGSVSTTETRLADLLDSTLWNRRLAPSSERIVYALVQQIFHGIREYFLASTELKFNCFLLMPVVDKLPALLREDLDSAFDDLENVFDITTMRHSLGQRKRETEIELKRIQRLKVKFRQIHEQLTSSQVMLRP